MEVMRFCPSLHDRVVPLHRRRHRRAGRRHRHGRPRDRLHVRPVQEDPRTSSRACSPAGKGLSFGGSLARTEATGYGLRTSWRVPGATATPSTARRSASPAPATWPSTPRRRPSSSAPRWLPCPTPPAGWGRSGGHRCRAAQAGQGSGARPPHRVRRPPRGRRVPRGPRRVGHLRHRALPWHATQNEVHGGRGEPREERLQDPRRGRQHAHHPQGHRVRAGARHRVLPGKAANAGGVATSGRLEMSQNSSASPG